MAVVPLAALSPTPLRVAAGDVGAVVQAQLSGGDGALVYPPADSALVFQAVERSGAPTKERRAARVFGGMAVPDMLDASTVRYTILASDIPLPGAFDAYFRVTYPTGETLTFPVGLLEVFMSNLTVGNSAALNLIAADSTGVIKAGSPAVPVVGLITGSVDLTTLTYPTGTGSADGLTVIASGITCTFVTPADAAAIVSQLNSAFSAGPGGATPAALSSGNLLKLAGLKITGGTALALLGLTTAAYARRFTSGVTFQNTDAMLGAWIGPAGIDGTATHPGYYLAPGGGSATYPPCDVGTLYVYAPSGAPVINWAGVDLA